MLLSLLVYLFVAFVMIYCGFVAAIRQRKNTNISFFQLEVLVPLLTYAIIFGCRYDVGVDYLDYLASYKSNFQIKEYEWLFSLIGKFFSNNGFHFSLFFGFIALIQIVFIFYAFRNQRFLYPWLSFVLIFGSYYLSFMNGMRQMMAVSIFVFSIQFIENKKNIKYFICVFVAALFHKSSWMYLLLYPIFQLRTDYFKRIFPQFLLLALGFILYYNSDFVLQSSEFLIQYYLDVLDIKGYPMRFIEKLTAERFGRNLGIGIWLRLILLSIIIFYSNKLKEIFSSKHFVIIYNLFVVGFFVELVASDMLVLTRPFRAFMFLRMVVVSYLLYYLMFISNRLIDKFVFLYIIGQYVILFLNIISLEGSNKAQFHFFWQF